MRSPELAPYDFRAVIVHDKGEIIQRDNYRLLFDSSRDHHFDKSALPLKNRHGVDQLLEFMFGNPIHQDFHYDGRVKVHVLSPLNDLSNSVLVSKLFTVKKKSYAIGLVIPVSMTEFEQYILSNWDHLQSLLQFIQQSFIQNHLGKPMNYLDVTILFKQLIVSMKNVVSIPRLLLGITQYDCIFQNWCFEVNNWIEIKDGSRNGMKFLPTLLTLVNGMKKQLVNQDSNEMVRVVIMAMNPIVVQKLIFILSGLLPYNIVLRTEINDEPIQSQSIPIRAQDTPSIPIKTKESPTTPSVINKGWEIPNTPSRSIATTTSIMTPSRIQPLSTSSSIAQLSSSLQSHNSLSSSLSRGFQLLSNWKNSLDSTNSSGQSYRSPSPNMEYDEYPWTYSSTSQPVNPGSLPRTVSSFDVNAHMAKLKRTMLKLPHIERNTVNVINPNTMNKTRNELMELMNRDLSMNLEIDPIKSVSILNVSYDDGDMINQRKFQTLPPLCGYIPEFTPGFKLQACPLSPEIESKISTTMKSDLAHYSKTRTIFVSLRVREIHEFIMSKENDLEIKRYVNKCFTNSKPGGCIDKQMFIKVQQMLQAANECDGSNQSMGRVRKLLNEL
jgi:hypothetical protein